MTQRRTTTPKAGLRGLVAAAVALLIVALLSPTAQAAPEPKAPEEFVALSSVDRSIIQEMRYITPHDFVGEPIDGYRQPLCILTRPAAEALHRAQLTLLRQGYSLKVYDCYRPQRAVDQFVRWAKDLADEKMKAEFYPHVDKSRLFADGYIAAKSGHSRGSTMDLTIVKLPAPPTPPYRPGQPLVPCYAPQSQRFPDNSLDMGTGFDCFDTLAHTDDPRIQGVQRANRQFLKSTMEAQGFVNLPEEWWHFTYQQEPFPDTYFDFPVARRSVAGH
ncbi:M15 family metallopeptidase [Streptomyces sp. NPDC050485]|uniref:M15 family metallopeptidase n=1 Tax=Streptomyces sp. NPDC050485 TaxID=3365617 RepID=UPI0037B7FD38